MTNHIVLADNQAIFRAGAARVLAAEDDMRIVAHCEDAERLFHLAGSMHGCILLVALPLAEQLQQLSAIAKSCNNRLILLTEQHEAVTGTQLLFLDGLLSRHTEGTELVDCIRRVGRGERCVSYGSKVATDEVGLRVRDRLTARELQIIGYIVRGCKNREIAERLGTKEQVIKNYLRSVYDKTGVSDRLELALFTLHHRSLAEAAAKASQDKKHPENA